MNLPSRICQINDSSLDPRPFSLFKKEVTQWVMHSFVGSITLMLQPLTTHLQDELTIKNIK